MTRYVRSAIFVDDPQRVVKKQYVRRSQPCRIHVRALFGKKPVGYGSLWSDRLEIASAGRENRGKL